MTPPLGDRGRFGVLFDALVGDSIQTGVFRPGSPLFVTLGPCKRLNERRSRDVDDRGVGVKARARDGGGWTMGPLGGAIFRTPLAVALGSMAFTVGFYRLVVFSARFTARMIRGETPTRSLLGLKREVEAADSLKPPPHDRG